MLLREHYGKSNPEFELLYKRLRASVVCKVEYVNLSNPFDTEWENTKIVKLLCLAELNTEKIGVMTSLTRAGEFIKKQDPDCIPKRYGIKTLKGVLKASGLFEVIESQNGESSSVLYKSAD